MTIWQALLLEHSSGLNFEDRQCHLQLIDRLSYLRMFANLVLQNLQQPMSSGDVFHRLSRIAARFGFSLRLHEMHLCSVF